MKTSRFIRYICIVYLIGVLIGTIFANCLAEIYIVKSDLFSEYYLTNYLDFNLVRIDFVIRILFMRIVPFTMIFVFRKMRIAKVITAGLLTWTGFSSGLLLSVELMNLGSIGVLFYLTGVFPQIIFYGLAYFLCFTMLIQEGSITRRCLIGILLILTGILFEIFVNPMLMKQCIQLMF